MYYVLITYTHTMYYLLIAYHSVHFITHQSFATYMLHNYNTPWSVEGGDLGSRTVGELPAGHAWVEARVVLLLLLVVVVVVVVVVVGSR